LTRNSQEAGTGAAASSAVADIVPVGGLAMARKMGFASSPAIINVCRLMKMKAIKRLVNKNTMKWSYEKTSFLFFIQNKLFNILICTHL
jgi:hypothetical protein